MKRPTEEQIRRRAYEIYQKHGKPGRDLQNWLQAERELTELSEREETATSVWEDTSTRRGGDADRVAVRSGRNSEYKKGF
jgi:hypothetical protein